MIRNKYESDALIVKMGLNKMLEGIFTKESPIEDVKKFLTEHPYKYYNLRDKTYSAGKFLYKLTAEEIIQASTKCESYERYAIYESLAEADEKLILQGEIHIDNEFMLLASLSDVKRISNRIAMQEPKYKIIYLDLKEHREPSIMGLKQIIDLVIEKELLNVVVEFSLFEIPVGVNNENIIIWELRNY